MKVSDIIIVSDLDGTIVPLSGIISKKNLDAIFKFREYGGTFTVATGRSPASAKSIIDTLKINGAFICNNGTQIYDCMKNMNLWFSKLPDSYVDAVTKAIDFQESIGVELITAEDETYIVKTNDMFCESDRYKYCSLDNPPKNICKVAMWNSSQEILQLEKYMLSHGYSDLEFVKSGPEWFEIMKGGVNKGYPLDKLAACYSKTIDNCFAIGDFYNDLGMIEKAGIGVAVGNAPQDIKERAQLIVNTCENDAIANLIDYIFEHFEK